MDDRVVTDQATADQRPEERLRSTARRMLDIDQVLALIPVGRTTLFRMERDGRFPPSHWPSPGRRCWFEDEVAAWQDALPTNGKIGRKQRSKSA
jgi:prophage regulatory protein